MKRQNVIHFAQLAEKDSPMRKQQKITSFAQLVQDSPKVLTERDEEYIDSSESDEDIEEENNLVCGTVRLRKKARKREKRPGVLQERETNLELVKKMIELECCDRDCIKQIDEHTSKKCRESFYMKTQEEQSNFIERNIRYYYILKRCREIEQDIDHRDGRPNMDYSSRQYLEAKAFVAKISEKYGDDQPDVEEIHLPSCLSMLQIWKEYSNSFKTLDMPHLSYQRFHAMWKIEFSHIKIPKYQKLSKSNLCVNFKEAIGRKLSKIELENVQEKKKCHLLVQEICREKYYKHIKKAKENPSWYASIIIDNMDQAKTNLPRVPLHFKNESSLGKMHHHVTGVLCHGLKKAYAFTWTDQFFSDCNITLNCLMKVLDDISRENGGHLPPTLYIQADNSPKDNKNKYVIMFLAMLVKAKIVKKIKLTFLMVGHTHEDVDQLFSRISTKAGMESIPTLHSLTNLIQRSYTPKPITQHLESLWDFRKQMLVPASLSGIKTKHVFRIKEINDEVVLSTKEWPFATEEYQHLNLHHVVPDVTPPQKVNPQLEKLTPLVATMKADIPKWVANGKLTDQDQLWWNNYLRQLERRARPNPSIPIPVRFRRYKSPNRGNGNMEENLAQAINNHMEGLGRITTARLVVHRPRI